MPSKALHFCNSHGCCELTSERYCTTHQAQYEIKEKQRKAEFDKERKSSHERGYTGRWQKASKAYLAKHPLCEPCLKEGKIHPADVVDHIVPHKGDKKLFWDRSNWQAMNKHCHDVKTARENGGFGNGYQDKG